MTGGSSGSRSGAGSVRRLAAALQRRPALAVFLVALAALLARAPTPFRYLVGTDHGHQLGAASEVLRGAIPGLDFAYNYGPAVPYTSAVLLWGTGSLLGETLGCAAAFAACLALVYALVARGARPGVGLAAAALAFCGLCRFYKWYVWLIPLGLLALLDRLRAAEDPAERRRWLYLLGAALGAASLYRFDLAGIGAAAVAAFVAWDEWRRGGPALRAAAGVLRVAAVSAAFPAAWFLFLLACRGPAGVARWVSWTFGYAASTASGRAHPFPDVQPSALFAPGSAVTALAATALVTFVVALVLGALDARRAPDAPAGPRLVAGGLVGLGAFHQTLHRSDGAHLLQALAPWFVVAPLLGQRLLAAARSGPQRVALGLGGLVIAGWAGVVLWVHGGADLGPPFVDLAARYRGLRDPAAAAPDNDAAAAVAAVRAHTGPDDALLAFPISAQLLAIADRPLAGVQLRYPDHALTEPVWTERALRGLAADPPAAAIVPTWVAAGGTEGRGASHPEVVAFLRERLPRVAYQGEVFAVVLRPLDDAEEGGGG